MIRPPRLRTLLLASNLAVLALPMSGLWALRLYESALVRQTQAELVAQAVLWSAAVRQELRRVDPAAAPAPDPRPGLSPAAASLLALPGLDLAADPVRPPLPDPAAALQPATPRAAAFGIALAPMVGDAQTTILSALHLLDPHGVIVASTDPDVGRSLATLEEVAAIIAGAPVAATMHRREPVRAALGSLSRTSSLRVLVALPVQGHAGLEGIVVLTRTPRDVWQAVWDKRWPLAGLLAALLAVGTLLAAGLSRLVARPLAVVVAQAERVAAGCDAQPIRHPGTREVATLSAALTRMAATLDRRARTISAFAASVSHAFKTPLAGLRGAAELLQDHADTLPAPERTRLLAIVAASTARLDHLVRRLLDLARADLLRPTLAPTAVRPVLAALVASRPDQRVTAAVGHETVAIPPDALDAILANLLDNAAAHAPGAPVAVTAASTPGWTILTVADEGPGIPPADRPHVFELFYTTARARGGTGLGLAIVHAIATGAGGSVTIPDTPGGTAIQVRLPAGPAPGPSSDGPPPAAQPRIAAAHPA